MNSITISGLLCILIGNGLHGTTHTRKGRWRGMVVMISLNLSIAAGNGCMKSTGDYRCRILAARSLGIIVVVTVVMMMIMTVV